MAPYNHEAPPSIQLRLDDDLNLPATINDNFAIDNKKDILEYDPTESENHLPGNTISSFHL